MRVLWTEGRIVVLVTGGRDFSPASDVWRALDAIHSDRRIMALVHGACPTGADKAADDWARQARGVHPIPVEALWDDFDKAAGPIRNAVMAHAFRVTLVLAFPGGKGTRSMRTIAGEAGIEVVDAVEFLARLPISGAPASNQRTALAGTIPCTEIPSPGGEG